MNNIENIEAFVDETMSEQEREAFLRDLDENPALKADYTAYLLLLEGTEAQISSNLKKKMSVWKDQKPDFDTQDPEARVFKINWRILSIAASLLIIVTAFFASRYTTESFNQLAYIESPMRSSGETQNHYNEAYHEYTHDHFDKAKTHLSKIKEDDPKFLESKIMKAMIFHQKGEKEKAINQINEVIVLSDYPEKKVFHEKMEFLKVKLDIYYYGITEQNKEWIQEIMTDSDHLYQEQARKLYNEKKSWWNFLF